MEVHEIAYYAGIFDGEGSISITKRKPRPGKETSPQHELVVCIRNQYLPVLEEIKQHFTGSLGRGDGGYLLYIAARRAQFFLETVKPYIRIKKAQLNLGLLFQELKNSRSRGQRLSDEECAIFDACHEEMKSLNKQVSRDFHSKSGEFSEALDWGNTEPSSLNDEVVEEKVQRLEGEESTNNPSTSARPEMEDIVRHSSEMRREEDKELLRN